MRMELAVELFSLPREEFQHAAPHLGQLTERTLWKEWEKRHGMAELAAGAGNGDRLR